MSHRIGLAQDLARCGLDICCPFSAQWYNEAIISEGLQSKLTPLPTFNRRHTESFLIGNTRALWEPLIAWNDEKRSDNPVDDYCREMVERSIGKAICPDMARSIHYSCESPIVSMQRVSEVCGLCYFDRTTTHLAIHPIFGTWLSFRAVVVVDEDAAEASPPLRLTSDNVISPAERRDATELLNRAITSDSDTNSGYPNRDSSWKVWLEMRDAIQTGKELYRFGNNQIAYHYTRSKEWLLSDTDNKDKP